MKTQVIRLKNDDINKDDLSVISNVFKSGGLCVFPTETVYGLGANGLDEDACKKIFEVKGRPQDNPLILHIGDISQLDELVEDVSEDAKKLIEKFWPGPITFIFNRSSIVPNMVTAGLDTVAIRMPSHPIANAILKDVRLPIAAPSANISGRPSITKFNRVIEEFSDKVDAIVDGGSSDYGIESTVVDTTTNPPMILRPGKITKEDLLEVLDDVGVDVALKDSDVIPKSPGQKYKHYAPKAESYCFVGNLDNVIKEINKNIKINGDKKIAVLATTETVDFYEGADLLIDLGSRENLLEVASNLFEDLRKCDDADVDIIYAEGFELRGIGASIMNRLLKACSGRVKFGL